MYAVCLLLSFHGFGQKGDPNIWTVTNAGNESSPTCTYMVELKMALRNTSTGVTSSPVWLPHSVAPGATVNYSYGSSPAAGYQIVVLEAKASFGSTIITGLITTSYGDQSFPQSCNNAWTYWFRNPSNHSFVIAETF
jgi:hypothetical protein